MRSTLTFVFTATLVLSFMAAPAGAVPLLTLGDPIKAIDTDSFLTASSYPAAENPPKVLDTNTSTKYLNFGAANSGLIVTPASGSSVVRSMILATANDHEERDPASFILYGTNDAIVSGDNSLGNGENWTLIASGPLSLPTTRLTVAPAITIANETAYTSYRLVFPTLKSALSASMQIATVAFYSTTDGTGTNILSTADTIKAIDVDVLNGTYIAAEGPWNAIDGSANSYRNIGGVNSGFIVTPWIGPTTITSFQITTSGGVAANDPTAYELYGTDDPILSTNNSTGTAENWTLIAQDALALPATRNTPTEVVLSNSTPYHSYRIIFPSLRDAGTATGMQIGDIQFFGTIVNFVPAPLIVTTDKILAIDLDFLPTSSSNYPAAESPDKVLDGLTTTKYLNYAKENSGFIVTPANPSVVQSMVLTTANDTVGRDPASFAFYGTNETIVSTNNSLGIGETWTLIAQGPLGLPDARETMGLAVSFTNAVSYKSYKLLFPTLKDSATVNSMQIADVAFFESTDGSGPNVLAVGNPILAVDADPAPTSAYPAAEGPKNAIDLTLAKYLNSGKVNSGFIVEPSAGLTNVTSFRLVTANDFPDRDPMAWTLWGTTDVVTSTDNSIGGRENWVQIANGTLDTPLARYTAAPLVTFSNNQVYSAYRLVFTEVRDLALSNSIQYAEVQFYGKVGLPCPTPFADADGDGDVDQVDFARFQECYTAAGVGPVTEDCRCFDVGTVDGDIDLDDLVEFNKCVTGPEIEWSLAVTPDCTP